MERCSRERGALWGAEHLPVPKGLKQHLHDGSDRSTRARRRAPPCSQGIETSSTCSRYQPQLLGAEHLPVPKGLKHRRVRKGTIGLRSRRRAPPCSQGIETEFPRSGYIVRAKQGRRAQSTWNRLMRMLRSSRCDIAGSPTKLRRKTSTSPSLHSEG